MNQIITPPNDSIAKRNVLVLILIQAFVGAMIPMHFTLGGPIGAQLSAHPALATMPVTTTIIGGMVASPIISRLSISLGRQIAFTIATLLAVFGLGLAALSISGGSFFGFCAGTFLLGFYMSAQGFFRFAATDMASADFRPRAISFALIGGLFSALISRYVVVNYSELNPSIPYLIFAGVALLFTGAYFLLRLPKPEPAISRKRVSIGPILRDRHVRAAMLISISAYAIMNLMMTSTPLAVEGCGFSRSDSTTVVTAHVLAMFAPSFFTGYLIKWFGLRSVVFTGIVILIASSIVALLGVELVNFYIALILLGIGWNFAFIGGTTMLTGAVKDPDSAKALQGVNDTILWTCVAIASLSSGVLMNYFGDGGERGWHLVNYAMLPVLIIALVVGGWLSRPEKAPQNA